MLPVTSTAEPEAVHGCTDADLLDFIALRDEDDELGRQAALAFYNRHAQQLYDRLLRFANALSGPLNVDDVLVEAFGRAFKHAGRYRSPAGADAEAVTAHVRAWLYKIAERCALDILRGKADEIPLDPDSLPAAEAEAEDEPTPPSPKRAALDACLEQLNPKQRDALLRSHAFYNTLGGHLPRGVAQEIAREIGTTAENLRQLRRRGETALRKCLGVDKSGQPTRL